MRLPMPCIYLVAITIMSGTVDAGHRVRQHSALKPTDHPSMPSQSIDAYRRGEYIQALQDFSTQSHKDAVAAYYLGRMNLYGYGQLKNNAKAMQFFSQSAEGGFLPAQAVMANYTLLEKKDPMAALYWYKKSADANDLQSQLYVAAAYLFGFGVNKNADKARQYYIGAAKQGSGIAQYQLAEYFLNSRQGENKKLGLIWLNKAALQHNPKAQLLLGKLYIEGKIVPQSLEQANQWIDAAIAEGSAEALVQKGDIAREEKDFRGAKMWYSKATDLGFLPAEVALGQLLLDEKSTVTDLKLGYLWILKAAQADFSPAEVVLSNLYKTGKGVEVSEALAKEWQSKSLHQAVSLLPEVQVARWLSNGKSQDFAASGYQLKGIFSDWKNPEAQKQNSYNPAPHMVNVTREMLYKPNFALTMPNEIPISDYYDALALSLKNVSPSELVFAQYPLDDTLLALKAALAEKASQKVQSILDKVTLEANLGDSVAEFDLGQINQYGLGVPANTPEAVRYYELAAGQEDLASMVALGILYLEGRKDLKADSSKGMAWLNNAAYKGNSYALFALASLNEHGLNRPEAPIDIPPNQEQADGFYFLAAANGNGMAQYRLAERLVRKKQDDVSVTAKQSRQALIKSLYQSAIANGVADAALPLAFFNAMDTDKTKQAEAFVIAKQGADEDKPLAKLLLGLLYDRGIGVEPSRSDALYWYQKAGDNVVSQFILGTYHQDGLDLDMDAKKVDTLLQTAATANFPYAVLNLAVLNQQQGKPFIPLLDKALSLGNAKAGLLLADHYLSLASDDAQMQEARNIYQQFAEKGEKDAQLKLAYMHELGLGGAIDTHTASIWYRLAADQGQPKAQYLLGRLYQLGYVGDMPDYAMAKQWYTQAQNTYSPAAVALGFIYDTVDDNYPQAHVSYAMAAALNDPIGQYNLGLMYEEGKGETVDTEKAKAAYQQAADQGNAEAMIRLGGLHFNAKDGKGDPQAALSWYKKAAEKGNRDAYYQLGLLSEAGVTTHIDYANALKDYEHAAKLGSQQGMLAAARMLQYGIGVAVNQKQAALYYEMLAGLGNAFAQYQLAELYEKKGIPETKSGEGKKWLQEALRNGSPQATQLLQRIAAFKQSQSSFVEPMVINSISAQTSRPVELMYLDALNQWNCGDGIRSKMIFDRIRSAFPDYLPAKRTVERMRLG